MSVFAVTRVEGNKRTILGKCKDLKEAKIEGKRIFESSYKRMFISLIEADFDENDRIIGQYKLYYAWW